MSRPFTTNMVILKTLAGEIVVRPTAPDDIREENFSFVLNEQGKQAWNDGEEVLFPDHVSCVLDLIGVAKAEF